MRIGSRRTLRATVGASAGVLLLSPALLLAQVGNLEGTVRDRNGRSQPGAAVEIAGRSLVERGR